MSASLWLHGPHLARVPCPSLSPQVCSNSCPLSWWCHPTTSLSVTPFFPCPQSSPASGSFPMSQLLTGCQSFGALASVFPISIQDWSPLGRIGWISLQSKGLSRIFPNTTIQKLQFFSTQPSLWSNSHICTWLWKNHSFDYMDLFVGTVMSVLFNALSRFDGYWFKKCSASVSSRLIPPICLPKSMYLVLIHWQHLADRDGWRRLIVIHPLFHLYDIKWVPGSDVMLSRLPH